MYQFTNQIGRKSIQNIVWGTKVIKQMTFLGVKEAGGLCPGVFTPLCPGIGVFGPEDINLFNYST